MGLPNGNRDQTLTPEQESQLAALNRIDAAGQEWKAALESAVAAGVHETAIQTRVMALVRDVFGVDVGAVAGMLG